MSGAIDHELANMYQENNTEEGIAVTASKAEPVRPPEIELHGTPEARTKLWSELAQAKAEFGKILKATPGQKGQQTFKYANLAAIFGATDSPLADHGICLILIPTNEPGNATTCYTAILSGHGAELWSRYYFSRPQWGADSKRGPFSVQDYGGLLTYFRRYIVQSILGIEGDRDLDDGSASDGTTQRQDRQTPQSTQQQGPRPQQRPQQQRQPRPQQQAPSQEPPAEKPRQEPEKPKSQPPPDNEMYADGFSDGHLAIVQRTLVKLTSRGEDGKSKMATVADVQDAINRGTPRPSKPFSEALISGCLRKLEDQGDAVSVVRGELRCYLAETPEDRGEVEVPKEPAPQNEVAQEVTHENTESVTDKQQQTIVSLYKQMWGHSPGENEVRRDLRTRMGCTPKQMNRESAETLIDLLQKELQK